MKKLVILLSFCFIGIALCGPGFIRREPTENLFGIVTVLVPKPEHQKIDYQKITEEERKSNNLEGEKLHYSRCPNCGDRWNWKTYSSLCFNSYTDGVIICDECLFSNERVDLDIEKISRALKNYGWKDDDIKKVREAVTKYKKEGEIVVRRRL
jgi:hypothetical protein